MLSEKETYMKQVQGKLLLVLIIVMAVALFFSTRAIAGIVIENYNPTLNGARGVITKIEGNKITSIDSAGNLFTIGVRGESTADNNKIRLLHVGDKTIIKNGRFLSSHR